MRPPSESAQMLAELRDTRELLKCVAAGLADVLALKKSLDEAVSAAQLCLWNEIDANHEIGLAIFTG